MGWKLSYLMWPNTVFSRALADAIQRAHEDCKNKHAVHTAIILFAQCSLYLCYFSSRKECGRFMCPRILCQVLVQSLQDCLQGLELQLLERR